MSVYILEPVNYPGHVVSFFSYEDAEQHAKNNPEYRNGYSITKREIEC